MTLRSPLVMIGLIALAVLLLVIGIYIQVSPSLHSSAHAVSYKAIGCWAGAVAALIGASFARPRAE